MANLKFNNTMRDNMLDEITTFVGVDAVINIYSGTQPSGGASDAGSTKLAVLAGNGAAFAIAASGGVLDIASITAEDSAIASGDAQWFRILTSGLTWAIDGDCGTQAAGSADMQFDDIAIVQTGNVSLGGTNRITMANAP